MSSDSAEKEVKLVKVMFVDFETNEITVAVVPQTLSQDIRTIVSERRKF